MVNKIKMLLPNTSAAQAYLKIQFLHHVIRYVSLNFQKKEKKIYYDKHLIVFHISV